METRAHYIVIGLATLAATLAALIFALWLAKAGGEKDSSYYDIVFTESVTGLSVGSQVLYNGIPMGEVSALRLDKKDPRKVRAKIALSDTVPVTEATRARLTIANITGAAVIQLVAGPPDSPPLKAPPGKLPVIEASPSPFTQLRSSSEELVVNITRLAENASNLLSEENAGSITRILSNLESVTATVAAERESIATTLEDLAAATRETQAAMAELSDLAEKANTSFDRHGEALIASARESLRSAETVTKSLERIVAENEGALSQGVRGMAGIGPLLEELRTTINALGQISRRLQEDPGGYLLGGEQIQEYQP